MGTKIQKTKRIYKKSKVKYQKGKKTAQTLRKKLNKIQASRPIWPKTKKLGIHSYHFQSTASTRAQATDKVDELRKKGFNARSYKTIRYHQHPTNPSIATKYAIYVQ